MARAYPPGPPLPSVAQAGLVLLNPTWFIQACHRRYGDVFAIRIPRIGTLVYLGDPDHIRTVTRGDPAVYRGGDAAAPLSQVLGTKSLIMLDEDQHKRSRGMMLPAFHGDSVRRQI